MATIVTHAVVGLALGRLLRPGEPRRSFWWAAALLPVAPDLDVLAHWSGVPYHHPCGHRGATHSVAFAAALSLLVAWRMAEDRRDLHRLFPFFTLATASHALLDMLTNGGLGVALGWPLSGERVFFGWRPLFVPPLSIGPMFSSWGADVAISELLWVWLPLGILLGAAEVLRIRTRAG
jgi:inner membrane protein